jgi:hypothetical protein
VGVVVVTKIKFWIVFVGVVLLKRVGLEAMVQDQCGSVTSLMFVIVNMTHLATPAVQIVVEKLVVMMVVVVAVDLVEVECAMEIIVALILLRLLLLSRLLQTELN